MPGTVNGKTFQGSVYVRATADDFTDFDSGITEANFETAFPDATAKYADAADGTEITDAPEGEYSNAQGSGVSVYTRTNFTINLTGLSKAEIATLKALQNKQVDIAVKQSLCGENGLGGGTVFRNYNLHIGMSRPIGGVVVTPLTVNRKYPACNDQKVNQDFDIIAGP